jgi:hypothetical protein
MVMELLKKYWAYLLALIGGLVGLVFYERGKKQEAEAKLRTAETSKKDAVIEEKKHQMDLKIEELENKKEELKEELDKKLDEANEDTEDFYKKRGI